MSKSKIVDMVIRLAKKVAESQISNLNAISKLSDRIKELQEENKMLRQHLGVEMFEESIEGGIINKNIRKIK